MLLYPAEDRRRVSDLTPGILLYEIFQQQPPYNTRLLPELKRLVESQPISFAKPMDPRLKTLVRKMLQKNPVKRPSCQGILKDRGFRQLLEKFDLQIQAISDRSQQRNR